MSSYASQKLGSIYDELDTPLLDQTEVDYDDDDEIVLREVTPSNLDLSQKEQEQDSPKSHEMLMWSVLAGLMFCQFAMGYMHHQDGTQEVSLWIVCASIGVFLLSAWLYHNTMRESCTTMFFLLLPELAVNVMLLLILLGKFSLAFTTLLGASLVFSAVVVLVSFHHVCSNKNDIEQQDEDVVESNALTLCQTV